MTHKVLLHLKAAEYLEKQDPPIQQRIKNQLKKLKEPKNKGKQLTHTKYFSLRIGDYRAIYTINHKEQQVIILFIGHRKNVYDDFSKIF